MRIVNFSNDELKVVKIAIEFGIRNWQKELVEILKVCKKRVSQEEVILSAMEKRRILACLKVKFIDPNFEIYELSDFELLSKFDKLRDRIQELDYAAKASNKLSRKKDEKIRIIQNRLSKISDLIPIQKVYYSISEIGLPYKIGLEGENGKGIKLEETIIENISLQKIFPNQYVESTNPDSFLLLLKEPRIYGLNKEWIKRVEYILERKMVY